MKRTPITIVTIALILYIFLVFFCCLYKFSGTDNIDLAQYFLGIRLDRYIHFTMFFPYPFVAWLYIKSSKRGTFYSKYKYSTILLTGLILASVAEASQEMLTSYRDTDPFDLIANFMGISVATIIVYIFRNILSRLYILVFGQK